VPILLDTRHSPGFLLLLHSAFASKNPSRWCQETSRSRDRATNFRALVDGQLISMVFIDVDPLRDVRGLVTIYRYARLTTTITSVDSG
jgi:hypothetical protein